MEAFVGEIRFFAFTYAPQDWAFCDGTTLPINQYQALFSLIGTIYGGNGSTTFQLPDLRGRFPMGQGSGPGQPNRSMGEMGGNSTTTLQSQNLPPHTHSIRASSGATSKSPSGAYPGFASAGASYGSQPDLAMSPGAVTPTGQGAPYQSLPPYLVGNWCIALNGIYPSRP